MTPTETVFAHLRDLAQASAACAPTPWAKRGILEFYFAADTSILNIDAQVRPAVVANGVSEWVLADNADPDRRLLYIHGGSWMAGSPATHRPLTSRLSAATGCAVLSVAYRLAPENPFPDGLNDCLEAYAWMLDQGPDKKGPATAAFIAGDSAGGNLTLAMLTCLPDRGLRAPNAAAAFSPATDLRLINASITERAHLEPVLNTDLLPLIVQNYTQGLTPVEDSRLSPIFADPSIFPPLLVQCGDHEVLLDDSVLFAERAREHDAPVTLEVYPGMPHVFQGFAPLLPEAGVAIQKTAEFFQSHLSPS